MDSSFRGNVGYSVMPSADDPQPKQLVTFPVNHTTHLADMQQYVASVQFEENNKFDIWNTTPIDAYKRQGYAELPARKPTFWISCNAAPT